MSDAELIKARYKAADSRPRREREWVGILLHHTGLIGLREKSDSGWQLFFSNLISYLTRKDDAFVSAHYLVSRMGEIVELVDPETSEAFHAGVSSYFHPILLKIIPDWNRYAIGIELVGDGNLEPYTDQQYEALGVLYKDLLKRYPTIHPSTTFIGHQFVAPGRKFDPGKLLDWHRLKSLVYGAI
jgi:N-acetyl-anhydromuramyl-L-alanine amidase AmpD